MTLGRTSSGSIKLKTDEAGGGLRAVECACCESEDGYYGGGDYICSDSDLHPIFGPQVDYWVSDAYHSVLSDGSISYSANAYSLTTSWRWTKTSPPGSNVDFTGIWTPAYDGVPPATFTLSDDIEPRCSYSNRKTLMFNVQIPVWNYTWTDDGLTQCSEDEYAMTEVYACWIPL